MKTLNLTQQQKDTLAKAGIDWQKLLNAIQTYGPMVMQLILALLGQNPPSQNQELKGISDSCPCPDGRDGCACCHAGLHHAALAIACGTKHCCAGDQCDTKCCCKEMTDHLLKAIEACCCHCNA